MNDDDVLYDARGDVARGDVALDDVARDDIAHDMLPVILLPVIVSVECWPLDAFATMMNVAKDDNVLYDARGDVALDEVALDDVTLDDVTRDVIARDGIRRMLATRRVRDDE